MGYMHLLVDSLVLWSMRASKRMFLFVCQTERFFVDDYYLSSCACIVINNDDYNCHVDLSSAFILYLSFHQPTNQRYTQKAVIPNATSTPPLTLSSIPTLMPTAPSRGPPASNPCAALPTLHSNRSSLSAARWTRAAASMPRRPRSTSTAARPIGVPTCISTTVPPSFRTRRASN